MIRLPVIAQPTAAASSRIQPTVGPSIVFGKRLARPS